LGINQQERKQVQEILYTSILRVTSVYLYFYITDLDKMADLADKVGIKAAPPDGEQVVPVPYQVWEMVGIDFLLHAIGFTTYLQRANLMESGLVNYKDFQFINKKDIWDMVE
jgi:hypothetical protein